MAATPPDLVGQRFNDWTVLEYSHRDDKYTHWWRVQCVCGTIRTQRQWVITTGKSKRCAACGTHRGASHAHAHDQIARWNREDLGDWTVLAYAGKVTRHKVSVSMWTCRCRCGAVIDLPVNTLGKSTMPVCRHGVDPTTAAATE